jgi:hypothetical protein
VADAEGVPGVLIKIAGMAPPYCPPAYIPSKKPKAATGSMPNVNGKKSAMVILVVIPGTAPKVTPTVVPRKVNIIFVNVKTAAISNIFLTSVDYGNKTLRNV